VFTPRGFGASEVGDIELAPAGGEIHLFHLTLPNHDVVQHAVSRDGLAWQPLPAALRTGDPGACDDDQIWTMSVAAADGSYTMLYTALSRADHGRVQRTALARSSDLIRWHKLSADAIAAADPRWYETDLAATGAVSWRDPKPIRIGDTWYAMVCAREREGPLARRGCVGLMTSPDLMNWVVQPPLFAPRRFWDLECPQVFTVGGTAAAENPGSYYLTAAIMEDRSQRYWTAPHFMGPYSIPADGGVLAPAGHYAGRVCRWRNLDLLWCWHQPSLARGWVATPETNDWSSLSNPYGKFVVAPLVLQARPDGSLARHPFPGWTDYRVNEPEPLHPAPVTYYRERGVSASAGWRVDQLEGGMDLLTTPAPVADCWIEGVLNLAAISGGFGFRLDSDGSGYFVELRVGASEVTLQKWLPVTNPRDGRRSPGFVELQRGVLRQPLAVGAPLPFRLLVVGPYIECSLHGEVVLAELSEERTSGRFGIWVDSGTVSATELRWAPMRRPDHAA
jgi:beta-fructofuranosidase